MTGLPLVLDVAGARCLVVGAGVAGRRKIAALHAAGAEVTVVDPAPSDIGGGRHLQRSWQAGDSKDMLITVVATNQPAVNETAAVDARNHRSLVLRADRSEAGDLRLPAVYRTGRVTVALDTSGASPTLAGFLRDRVAEQASDWAELAEWAGANRPVTTDSIDQYLRLLGARRKDQRR